MAAGIAASLLLVVPVAAQTGANAEQSPAPTPAPPIGDPGGLRGPEQPIFFRHDVHAGQFQIPCLYCHATVTISSEPGIPSLQTCIGCHQILSGGQRQGIADDSVARRLEITEIEKLVELWRDRRPPEWIRIHAVPQFVRFPHQRHVSALGDNTLAGAGATCVMCHGDVGGMAQVYRVESLRMGWCVRCHVQREVSRDCTVCHY
jgi:hypothetical protein